MDADQSPMVLRRTIWALAAFLALTACSGDDFGRGDAIIALSTTGLTEVESTCVADALVALGQLRAADPRQERGESQREALVSATGYCVGQETVEVAGRTRSDEPLDVSDDEDPEGTPLGELGALSVDDDPLERRRRAVAHLELAGRSNENARCVVDQLVTSEAEAIFADPAFGLGLDPLEADAFAACIQPA